MRDGDDDGGDEYADASQGLACPPPSHCQRTSSSLVAFCALVCVKASLAGIDFCCDLVIDHVTYDRRWEVNGARGTGWVSDPRSSPRFENSAPPEWSRDCPRRSQRRS